MSRRHPHVAVSLESETAPAPAVGTRRHVGGSGLGGGSMTQQVALFVLIITMLGAAFAYLANVAQIDAGRSDGEAAQRRSQAAAQTSEVHARRTDQALNELARDLVEPAQRKAALQARADALKEEKDALRGKAEKLEATAALWDEQSKKQRSQQHRWIEAVMVLQLALLLAAMALLTRKVWIETAMIVTGLAGVAIGVVTSLYS